jgi:hypothetical protein
VIYHMHGGGFVAGDLNADDVIARDLALNVPAVVVSVNYRLAPEHPHAPVIDCYRGLLWVARHASEPAGHPARLGIYGNSAGGGLAVATSLTARDGDGPAIDLVMATAPMLDDRDLDVTAEDVSDPGAFHGCEGLAPAVPLSRAIVAARRAALRRWAAGSPGHALDPNPSRAIANGVLKAESGLPDSG